MILNCSLGAKYTVYSGLRKFYLDQNYIKLVNLNLAKWPLQGSHFGHVEVTWPAQGSFVPSLKFAKMVDLPIAQNTTNIVRVPNPATWPDRGEMWHYLFSKDMGRKTHKTIQTKTLHLLLLCSFSKYGHAGPFLLIFQILPTFFFNTIIQHSWNLEK